MLRHALVSLFAVTVVAVAAPGCSPEQLTLSDYDTSCMEPSECVGIYVGDCSSCMCPNAAINQDDYAKYQGDVTALECSMSATCDCPATKVTCTGGKCAIAK